VKPTGKPLSKEERALLRLSRQTLRSLAYWPAVRELWRTDIEAGRPFPFSRPGADSLRAFEATDEIYERARMNVERLSRS
jgi:hypothetical protein